MLSTELVRNAADVQVLATDVGFWMALPAFGPAFLVVGVVFFIARRDRRRNPVPDEAGEA